MRSRVLYSLLHLAIPFHVAGWSSPQASPKKLATKMPQPSRREVFAVALLAPLVSSFPLIAEAKNLSEEYRQGTLALKDMDDQAPVPREAYKKLPSGVIYADLRPGKGATVQEGSKVNIQWVLRKSNGYFVDSSAVQGDVPFIFTVGDGTAIKGVDEGIRGIQEGGVRRILMPPSLAYVDGLEDGKPGPLPAGFGPRQQMRRVQTVRKDVPGEYVFLEVQATRVR
uniref:peptidylprolyl isomerase n=1 Tax=Amphora coffeiformis TaxID=265554 RepID=A0A7S3L467_9STRA|mmetsp:Transcript_21234/g.40289  ORF Transcript_21234/g.40289 Transcript_21234/m.40289 type:complete len:225 (+) Transcript_21234:74-748(+)